jgi:hypothetical protein
MLTLAWHPSAYGAEPVDPATASNPAGPSALIFHEALATVLVAEVPVKPEVAPTLKRPVVLPVLYVSLAALQVHDGYATAVGLSRGAEESNPLMRGIAGQPVVFWTVKTAATAGAIWTAERLWKRHRAAAVVAMIAVNGVMASVAARNVVTLRTLR